LTYNKPTYNSNDNDSSSYVEESIDQERKDSNSTVEYKKNKKRSTEEESSGHDSIVYTKDLKNTNNVNKLTEGYSKEMRFDTLESCTSSEFRAGIGYNEESFISQGNNDIGNLNIDIKYSNI
jgi:hypothetical protein